MAIYTRTGDKGKTSLMSGQRVSKADLRVDTYGTIDELNSAIGVVLAEVQNSPLRPASAKAASFAEVATKAESAGKQDYGRVMPPTFVGRS